MLALTAILVFIGAALNMLIGFSADAERMDMEQVLGNIRQSILVTVGEQMIGSDLSGLERLAGSNPILLLRSQPDNYVGERGDLDEPPDAGHWYFNYDRNQLIYRVVHAGSFHDDAGPADEAAFKLTLVFTDNNSNGRYDRSTDRVQSLKLEPQALYQWLN